MDKALFQIVDEPERVMIHINNRQQAYQSLWRSMIGINLFLVPFIAILLGLLALSTKENPSFTLFYDPLFWLQVAPFFLFILVLMNIVYYLLTQKKKLNNMKKGAFIELTPHYLNLNGWSIPWLYVKDLGYTPSLTSGECLELKVSLPDSHVHYTPLYINKRHYLELVEYIKAKQTELQAKPLIEWLVPKDFQSTLVPQPNGIQFETSTALTIIKEGSAFLNKLLQSNPLQFLITKDRVEVRNQDSERIIEKENFVALTLENKTGPEESFHVLTLKVKDGEHLIVRNSFIGFQPISDLIWLYYLLQHIFVKEQDLVIK